MEDKELLEDYDYVAWHNKRSGEMASWKCELDRLIGYKNHVNNILQQIEDGTAEQSLKEQENEFK